MWRAYVATSVWTTDTGSWLTLSPYTSFLDRRVSSSLLEAGTETLIQEVKGQKELVEG